MFQNEMNIKVGKPFALIIVRDHKLIQYKGAFMNKFNIILMVSFLFASLSVSAAKYEFKIPQTDLVFKTEASDELKAREIASEKCFDHFVAKKKISREYGVAAIDVCINLK